MSTADGTPLQTADLPFERAALPAKVAVVEDEGDILETLCFALHREGYEAAGYPDGAAALLAFRDLVPDLAIIDWMLPGLSGLDLCRILRNDRRFARTGLMILTARGTEMDIVMGLNAGADDYVVKPFSTRELVARLRALHRRCRQVDADLGVLRVGNLWLESPSYRAGAGDEAFDLTPREFRILDLLLRHPGRVYTRGQILGILWPDDASVEERAVDVHIARLREKMGDFGALVETVRGIGYRLRGG
jgi:two-component system phosphate regulon response regulator PhoB